MRHILGFLPQDAPLRDATGDIVMVLDSHPTERSHRSDPATNPLGLALERVTFEPNPALLSQDLDPSDDDQSLTPEGNGRTGSQVSLPRLGEAGLG